MRAYAGALLAFLAALSVAAAGPPKAIDYRADARSIEALANANYAYLDRFAGERMPFTAKLRAEAEQVIDQRNLIRFSERALMLLADHHAITGSSVGDSRALVPSFADLWIEGSGTDFVIDAVRQDSPAALAGIRAGDRLATVDGRPAGLAVKAFWADLGTTGGGERDGFAARVLAAGRRDRARQLSVRSGAGPIRKLLLPSLYSLPRTKRPPVTVEANVSEYRVRFNDSLGDHATIAAFDSAMAAVPRSTRLVIDLRDTPSGGNTSVARAVLGWFVARPTFYQIHNLPAEERMTGISRQWAEQVLPRVGKWHSRLPIVRVGRWTGSMGEGLAIGFDSLGARVEGGRMARLRGAIHDYRLEQSGMLIKLPAERLYAVDGTPRERFVPRFSIGDR